MVLELLDGEKASVSHDDCTTYKIDTELVIHASAAKVWQILTDYEKWAEWSPGPIHFEGKFEKDGPAKITFLIGVGNHTQVFDHPLIHFEEGKLFGWSAPLPHMGMTDNHKYIVEPIDGTTSEKCKIIQTDEFHGNGAILMGGMMANGAKTAYVEFNRALKKRAEAK